MSAENDFGSYREFDAKNLRFKNGGRPLVRAPYIHDHFVYGAGALNSHVPQVWVTTETGAATPYAPSTSVAGGALVATTGAVTNNAEELAGKAIIWQPSAMGSNVRLSLEVRAKFVGATTPADGDFYIGLADAVTYTNGLPFVVSTASALTTSAPVEFIGFGYSSIPTSGTLFNASGNNFIGLLSMKNSVAGTVQSSAIAKDSNFHVYRVEVDASANAALYIDDVLVGTVAAATTAATKLTPYFSTIAKNSHTNTATIDYIHVGGDLV